jgi:hypothetical protein
MATFSGEAKIPMPKYECESCGSVAELESYPSMRPGGKHKKICYLCATTFCSNWTEEGYRPDIPIYMVELLKSICQVGNAILEKIDERQT